MRFTGKSIVGPIATCLRLFAVAVICAFSADAVAGGYSTPDQPQIVPTTVVVGADNPHIDVPTVQSAVDQGTGVINTHTGECFGLAALFTNAAAVRIERNDVRNVGRQADDTGPSLLAAAGIPVRRLMSLIDSLPRLG